MNNFAVVFILTTDGGRSLTCIGDLGNGSYSYNAINESNHWKYSGVQTTSIRTL